MRRRRRRPKTAIPVTGLVLRPFPTADRFRVADGFEVAGEDEADIPRPAPPVGDRPLPTCCSAIRERQVWGSTVAFVTIHDAACPHWSSR
ncbi:hypothetical protein ACFYNO_14365 [Kitasatospora sp. NPDC006697]|uniref:hypothetical protein n=1 Tax=unclassified Kitasatospora TaxID=2633591 RepID=UPI0036839C11